MKILTMVLAMTLNMGEMSVMDNCSPLFDFMDRGLSRVVDGKAYVDNQRLYSPQDNNMQYNLDIVVD